MMSKVRELRKDIADLADDGQLDKSYVDVVEPLRKDHWSPTRTRNDGCSMSREEFYDSLRNASRMLAPPAVRSDQGAGHGRRIAAILHSADIWLTPKSVEAYEANDFSDWPVSVRKSLQEAVGAFLVVAEQVPADKPATRTQSRMARKHLETVIELVRGQLLKEWLDALEKLMVEATEAAKTKGWYVDQDNKKIIESLLGVYEAPRLRIRNLDFEVVLDPIACFGSGRQGVVDLVVLPTFETAYLITFKNGRWEIVSTQGAFNSRPFSGLKLVNTITKLTHA